MLYTDPLFIFLFLPLLLLVYVLCPTRWQNVLLTLASLAFYATGEKWFLPWLIGSIALNYAMALAIDRARGTALARAWLIVGLASDLLLLVYFKYAGFLVQSVNLVLAGAHRYVVPEVLLPLGISFFTFHKISYKIDVYRGTAPVRRNPLDLALYILLFPQLIAGPIIRYHDIADELVRRHLTLGDFAEGVRRFVIGLGKKMLIANAMAGVADPIFDIPAGQLDASLAWLGMITYTLQIYFDFSGYSDMAIGLGRMFGFHFPENFDHPYISQSITEFWRRWHMSLSRWFRDYLYIPLGGNRSGSGRTYVNLLVVFFLCGLWHGASWNFVVWGLFHGAFLVLERTRVGTFIAGAPRAVRHGYTLLVVMVGWVFFRAPTLTHALGYLRGLLGGSSGSAGQYDISLYVDGLLATWLVIGFITAAPVRQSALAWVDSLGRRFALPGQIVEQLVLGTVLLASAMEIAAGTYNPFIYFRF